MNVNVFKYQFYFTGDERTYSGFLYDVNRFEHTFPGFSQTAGRLITESPKITPSARYRFIAKFSFEKDIIIANNIKQVINF